MTFNVKEDLLFVGLGNSGVAYYRAMLPAMALGCDWAGVIGEPPELRWLTGIVGGESRLPEMDEYKVVVIQQPTAPGWIKEIARLQAAGVKVLYEVDDHLHSIPKLVDHDFRKFFDKPLLSRAEAAMRLCDGMIVSTERLAKRYADFNANIFVCENGLDLRRYKLSKPERDTVNIGWAGATGHTRALAPWLRATVGVMASRKNTTFVSVGQPQHARTVQRFLGADRALGIPFCAIEQYPGAMTMFDIGLAPAGRGGWYLCKSDLRWLEAGALGIPLIADPLIYHRIEHGVNGFHADADSLPELLVRLVDDPELRTRVGNSAQDYVRSSRGIEHMAPAWAEAATRILTK